MAKVEHYKNLIIEFKNTPNISPVMEKLNRYWFAIR